DPQAVESKALLPDPTAPGPDPVHRSGTSAVPSRKSWSPPVARSPSQATAPMRACDPARPATTVSRPPSPLVTARRPSFTIASLEAVPVGSRCTTTSAHPAIDPLPPAVHTSATPQVPDPPARTCAVTSTLAW